MAALIETTLHDAANDVLRRSGNPFRNYFARNPDDDVCARYHVNELYENERAQLLGVVDLYRYDPTTHSEVVPVLGNKGSGKTHLLHTIKHGYASGRQLLVTPGTFQKGADFQEYLLFQVIDTLLGGGKQAGQRPLEYVSEELTRRLLRTTLMALDEPGLAELFPGPAFARWARKIGIGNSQAGERAQWIIDNLNVAGDKSVLQVCREVGLPPESASEAICAHVDQTEVHNTTGQLRRRIFQGFVRANLLNDESDLAGFLTYGFAEVEYHIRPTRHDLVLALTKVLMEVFLQLKVPVVVAFDQLEDLLLVRRTDDGHKVSEAFFAGIVQTMHQVDGICFLIFAERGLWNRFIPSLDGYIQDRLNNPVHVPQYGTIKVLRLEPPVPDLVQRVVETRLQPALEELGDLPELSPVFPFSDEQVERIARTEPTLRDMLQQFRRLYDHIVYGAASPTAYEEAIAIQNAPISGTDMPGVKSISVVEAGDPSTNITDEEQFRSLWDQQTVAARTQLEPDGAMTGAARELQGGLGSFLQHCHEHGVKVGPWRLQHVVPEYRFGDHPTYGAVTIAHWSGKDGQPWRLGIGLFLGRGPGKLKDLQVKLSIFDNEPPVVDHLILLRPADDPSLSGKSKSLIDETGRRGRHTRLESMTVEEFAALYAFPRWLTACAESLPDGQPLPNLADFFQDHCRSLLEHVCLATEGGE